MAVSSNLVAALATFSIKYDRFMRVVSREARNMGYAPAEAVIIDNLRGHPLSQSQLRKLTQIERGQLSRAIKNLIAKGIITPTLGRTGSWSAYELTALGWRHYHDASRARLDAIETAIGNMLRPERKALVDALEELGSHNAVNDDFMAENTAEEVRYRTAYPGEVATIIKNALDFYCHKGLKFNSQIEGYILRQFAKACERTHHHIIVFERHGFIAGSVVLLVDQKNASACLEGLWFVPGWCQDEDIIGVLKLAEKRAVTAGCRNLTAMIPRHEAWPNMFPELNWKFVNVDVTKIAGQELTIETWSHQL